MIKHIWSVLCRESTINQDNNSLSIRDVLETLQIALKPTEGNHPEETKPTITIPLEYEIVSFLLKEDKEKEAKAELELTIYNPAEKEIFRNALNIIMPVGMKRMRTRMKIAGIQVQDSGEYTFQVGLKEEGQKYFKTVTSIPFEVDIKLENSSPN